MNLILGAGYAFIGLALIFWATPLSIRCNAWTTGLRERHPNINPPPTPEWNFQSNRESRPLREIPKSDQP
jgi:hypothetical protein